MPQQAKVWQPFKDRPHLDLNTTTSYFVVVLKDEEVERIARRVVELLDERDRRKSEGQ